MIDLRSESIESEKFYNQQLNGARMFEDQFAQVPTNPPRRVESLPGLRLAAVVPKSTLFLPLLFVAFFALIPLAIMQSDPVMRLAVGPAKTLQGRVLSSEDASTCGNSTAHRVIYAFSPEPGREFRGAENLCHESPYYTVKEGDAVEVQFLLSDPSVNALHDGNANGEPPVVLFMLFPVFFLAMFSPMFVPQIREALRARRLFKKGQLALGTVVFVKRRATATWPGWPGSNATEVFIEFESIGKRRCESVAWCQNDWLVNQLAPGSKVHVAYINEQPEKVALLEAFLR